MCILKDKLSYIPALRGKSLSKNNSTSSRRQCSSLQTCSELRTTLPYNSSNGSSFAEGSEGLAFNSAPYDFLDNISLSLDGQIKRDFGDKAKNISSIAKVRVVSNTTCDNLLSQILLSPYSSFFESFDLDGFFSSLDLEKVRSFIFKHSTTACSFISRVPDIDLRNRAIVDVRSKVNELAMSTDDSLHPEIWKMLNLMSLMYYANAIQFLVSKGAYSSCYACQLFDNANCCKEIFLSFSREVS